MESPNETGETQAKASPTDRSVSVATRLDAQFGELIETVWKCERQWVTDGQMNNGRQYGMYQA